VGAIGTATHGRLVGGFLALWGGVTVVDIVVVHWILRRHRLYRGEHVTAVEAAVAGLGALALARGAASLRRAGVRPPDSGAGPRTAHASRPRR
jgi:hypothetical protein